MIQKLISIYPVAILGLLLCSPPLSAQGKSLVNTKNSAYAKVIGVDMEDVTWTDGFWAGWFAVCRDTMVPGMWQIFNDPDISHSFRNFEIAAGLKQGDHKGPPFHDGDFYKWLEAAASTYAVTKDEKIDRLMDEIIRVIAASQREDGYIHTPVMIEQLKTGKGKSEFQERLDFETYNFGHLMTAACVHYRATGKKSLLTVAEKATDYLYRFYLKDSAGLAQNAICPSHYMGMVEMYRTTKDPKYFELAGKLIDIRSLVENGTDHNQDRIPFRQQTKAVGHAVRANYLYAGVSDVFLETGDDSLFHALELIWDDLVQHKLYVTGACGALYDGVSPDGTSYYPPEIQQIHQAYGRDFQLPNITAHNESCANIGNVLWNWRMFQITGRASYMDILELTLYNSVLSGVSLDGRRYFYTNPLCVTDDLTYTLRWSKEREEYITKCNCCPPNIVRTIAEAGNYAYSLSDKGIWVNLYGGNRLEAETIDGSEIRLVQETDYPWDGKITIRIEKAPSAALSLFLRIPGWCKKSGIMVNGERQAVVHSRGTYAELTREWSKGDLVELVLDMPVTLLEANPLVEETRNQVAVKRGPLVYCLESADLPEGVDLFDVVIPSNIDLKPVKSEIAGRQLIILEGEAEIIDQPAWEEKLYRDVSNILPEKQKIRLIPYYAWGNRSHSEMSVWLPLNRK
jgi:DUF1680 family protein